MSDFLFPRRFGFAVRGGGRAIRVALGIGLIALGFLGRVEAGTSRTQNIALVAGWNAVWLEVDPSDAAVHAVFDPQTVDVVARYFTPGTPTRFIEDPGEQAFNAPGWGVWYAPSRAEAFLTSLHAIQGNCAYLVHATNDAAIAVTGEVSYRPLRWDTDSYNLTGLPVFGAVGPSFGRFFSGAAGKVGAQVYRLSGGSWQKVGDLASATIRPGEAYWIYCSGKTNYQGPLEVRFPGVDGVTLGTSSLRTAVQLTNRASAAFSVTATLESAEDLPLFRSVLDLATLTPHSEPLGGATSLGNLSPGGVSQLNLELRPLLMTGKTGSALLLLSTSDGIVLRLPVRAALP